MRHFISLLCLVLLINLACKKTNSSIIANGTYKGTFQRLLNDTGKIADVTITFSSETWAGQGLGKYPALCNGTYKVNSAGEISFENACIWTAEFDWTLILGGNYKIKISGNNVEISRDYNGAVKDLYKLVKQ